MSEKERKLNDLFNYVFQKYKNIHGLYFLLNDQEKIGYIGKSTNLGDRIFTSITDSKIVLSSDKEYFIDVYLTNSKSDMTVYEQYYISKHKPKFNKDSKYDDSLTIALPELIKQERIKFIYQEKGKRKGIKKYNLEERLVKMVVKSTKKENNFDLLESIPKEKILEIIKMHKEGKHKKGNTFKSLSEKLHIDRNIISIVLKNK